MSEWLRALGLLGVVLTLPVGPMSAAADAPEWLSAAGGAHLTRPVYWEAAAGVSVTDDAITVDGAAGATPLIDRYGPRLHVRGDFEVTASLQAASSDLAALALVDAVPEDQWSPNMRRVEVGLEHDQVVIGIFDGTSAEPAQWQAFSVSDVSATSPSAGPVTLGLSREGQSFALRISGLEVARLMDPGVFQSGLALMGARVAPGNQLTLTALDVLAPANDRASVAVDRCTPTRLLAAGSDASDVQSGMWWIWPDQGYVRQVDPGTTQRSYLVSASPDQRWVVYYQVSNQYNPATDRFVPDTWVMDLTTDERFKLVEGNTPIGWISDSSAVVLGERPNLMALVPSGELVPVQGTLEYAQSMRSVLSPDGQARAVIDKTPQGAAGISILDPGSGDELRSIPTGRGAPQLAWSPDSARLAYTSGNDTPTGLLWRLRMLNLADGSVSLVSGTEEMHLHSVIWAPPLAGCT